ncbi:MAG: hypothetical protein MH321_11485 [Leptospiraceae bacterium]|nr:hypothetical protein [Leptospiraceae bacterium]
MFKRFGIIAILLLGTCNLPGLTDPSEYALLNLLARLSTSQEAPPLRLSLIYQNTTYNPGETIDLGMADSFQLINRSFILKNTGTSKFRISKTERAKIETNSNGSLELQPQDGQIPDPWEPGVEVTMNAIIIPGGQPEVTWKITVPIIEPEVTTQTLDFKMLVNVAKPARLFYSVMNPIGNRGLYSLRWNETTKILDNNLSHFSGITLNVTSANQNKFLYHGDSGSLLGYRLNSSLAVENVSSLLVGVGSINFITSIPNANRILASGSGNEMRTISYNASNGDVTSFAGPFGTLCSSSDLFASPKGDFIIQPHAISLANPGRLRISRVNTDGSLTITTNDYTDADTANRLSKHWKSKSNTFFYSIPHTNVPGGNNFKVNSILKRELPTATGLLSDVIAEYSLGGLGFQFPTISANILVHPNDRWIYALGLNGTNPAVVLLNHDLNSGEISVANNFTKLDSVGPAFGSISPDGKYLAVRYTKNSSACPTCERTIFIYELGPNGVPVEVFNYAANLELGEVHWMSPYN